MSINNPISVTIPDFKLSRKQLGMGECPILVWKTVYVIINTEQHLRRGLVQRISGSCLTDSPIVCMTDWLTDWLINSLGIKFYNKFEL